MTDRLRWGYQLFPDHPSFRGVAKSTLDSSMDALDAVRCSVLSVARNTLAFVLTRPPGAAVLITGLSGDSHDTFGGGGWNIYSVTGTIGELDIQSAAARNIDSTTPVALAG